MAPILIVYGTTNGQTEKIARTLADDLRQEGAVVDVMNAATDTGLNPEDFGGVIVAASVHAGKYQRPVRRWVQANLETLRTRQSAFLSVCLGVLDPRPQAARDLAAILDRFRGETGWQPDSTKEVAGALLYTRYNWLTRWLMRRIARASGGDTDTSRDFEYTDWNDLRAFAHDFYARVRGEEEVEAPLRVAV
jgi:menaquinone-dependent protoporphyrinogen oxidase